VGVHVHYGRTYRHRQHQVFAFGTGAIAAGTLFAVMGSVLALKAVVDQSIQGIVGFQIHRTTVATVATVRPTPRHVFFTAETQATMAACTCFHNDGGFVYKFHIG